MSEVSLRQKPSGWEFISEAALEKFVWGNLSELFGLSPLKQQYITQGEICDILATDADGGLVILELKNTSRSGLTHEEFADGVEILSQAVVAQERALVQSLWEIWTSSERTALLSSLASEVRQSLAECLGILPGAIVRWLCQTGDWIVDFVDADSVSLVQRGCSAQTGIAVLADLCRQEGDCPSAENSDS